MVEDTCSYVNILLAQVLYLCVCVCVYIYVDHAYDMFNNIDKIINIIFYIFNHTIPQEPHV